MRSGLSYKTGRAMVLGFFFLAVGLAAAQTPPPKPIVPGSDTVIRVSPGVAKANLIKSEPPIAPKDLTVGKDAKVELIIKISKTGEVISLHAISGSSMLTAAAIDAVKGWKYRPYLLGGKPMNVETRVIVDFPPTKRKSK